jgi:hypothetical protein
MPWRKIESLVLGDSMTLISSLNFFTYPCPSLTHWTPEIIYIPKFPSLPYRRPLHITRPIGLSNSAIIVLVLVCALASVSIAAAIYGSFIAPKQNNLWCPPCGTTAIHAKSQYATFYNPLETL